MPTYQYSCTECGHFFEQAQSFSDDSLTVCPVCEGKLRKVFNAVGVVFKGSGFYRNDSRSAAESGSGKKVDSTVGASSSDGGDKGESSNGAAGTKKETASSGSSESSSTPAKKDTKPSASGSAA